MIGVFRLHEIKELVTRSDRDGVTDLSAAALIEQHGRFLLVQVGHRGPDPTQRWRLPTGPVLPGEKVNDGLYRILAQGVGYLCPEAVPQDPQRSSPPDDFSAIVLK